MELINSPMEQLDNLVSALQELEVTEGGVEVLSAIQYHVTGGEI
jgi:hypothetical protein